LLECAWHIPYTSIPFFPLFAYKYLEGALENQIFPLLNKWNLSKFLDPYWKVVFS
jgi:hypothetical protein